VATRGLSPHCHRTLKEVFKGAALTASIRGAFTPYDDTLHTHGMRPQMARLTLARKIAAITLAVWKKGEAFDPHQVLRQAA
jgi:transposase